MRFLLSAFLVASATAEFIQPGWRDEVHAVWVNGPTHSAQLGGGWPRFGAGASSNNAQCKVDDPSIRYTGYDTNGGFCEYASDALDQNPHLVMYSGNLGMVLDASAQNGNLFPKLGSADFVQDPTFTASDVDANLAAATVTPQLQITCAGLGSSTLKAAPLDMAQFGLVRQGHAVTQVIVEKLEWMTDASEKYAMDPICNQPPVKYPTSFNCLANYGFVEGNGRTDRSCPDPAYPDCLGFVAGSAWGKCHSDPLVDGDQPCSSDFGSGGATVSNPCETTDFPTCSQGKCVADAVPDPSKQNCNRDYGGGSWPCNDPNYQTCLGFVQGSSWGRCHSIPTNEETCDSDYGTTAGACPSEVYPVCNGNNLCSKDAATCFLSKPWFDITMWGDSIALHLHWDGSAATECSGQVQLEVKTGSTTLSSTTADFKTETEAKVVLTGASGLLQETTNPLADQSVTSSSSGAQVVERPDFGDFMVEIPTNTKRCGYSPCGNILAKVDVTATNSNPSDSRMVHLSLSRNFDTRYGISQSGTGAEITGLNVIVWNKATQQPNGIPSHISKNWHNGGSSPYRGYWWTANLMFRLPPGESQDLTFAIVYEQFKGIPAWSHAQLSIVGYSNKWLWEEAALGTGGENFVMDPLGSHTRAAITDVRPKLFDGSWKENVGGGDFLLYFNDDGKLQYKKELDAQLFVNGPNLSKATYTSLSLDGAIESKISISGSRTDDLVRVFIHVRHDAVEAAKFSRLAFFQMGSETYNYYATFQDFVYGDSTGVTQDIARTCTAGTNKASNKMYDSANSGVGVYRQSLSDAGPWWFAMGPNTNPKKYADDAMVVGDRGLVIRSFDARFGGQTVSTPSLSILCDKIELGAPLGLSELAKGDYVDMHLEFLVLPRPEDFNTALTNSPDSNSLRYLSSLGTTWERVQEQAVRAISVTSVSPGGQIESHYPVRVCVPDGMAVFSEPFRFTVSGTALGFVPVVICNLDLVDIPSDQGLWAREEGETTYELLSQETDARQANYDRTTLKYELVFNVEMLAEGDTEFGFGPDPVNTEAPTSASPTTISPSAASGHPSSNPTTGVPTVAPTGRPTVRPTAAPTASPSQLACSEEMVMQTTTVELVLASDSGFCDKSPTERCDAIVTAINMQSDAECAPRASDCLTMEDPCSNSRRSLQASDGTDKFVWKIATMQLAGSTTLFSSMEEQTAFLTALKVEAGLPPDAVSSFVSSSAEVEDPTALTNYFHVCAREKGTDGEFIPFNTTTEDEVQVLKETLAQNGTNEVALEGDAIAYEGGIGVVTKRCLVKSLVDPTSYGDPHFRTWSGSSYDFHGGCQLVLLKNPSFHNGLGMTVHIRTSIKTWWSYIDSAVVQIGKHSLEIKGGKDSIRYWMDGKDGQELKDKETAALGDFPVNFHRINQHQGRIRVDLGDGNAISFEAFRKFVRVNVKAKTSDAFWGTVGLMGSFPSGAKIARDNSTVMEDDIAFGKEWQVLGSEPMLFHQAEGVQHPQECAMPEDLDAKAKKRRLGESLISEEAAALACARVEEISRDACVFDVLATNEIDIVGSY